MSDGITPPPDPEQTTAWPGTHWRWYEAFCAALAALRGYTARLTATHDFGADVLLYNRPDDPTPVWAVQCKAEARPLGVEAVQAVYAATNFYGANWGVVASPVGFTTAAQEMAARLSVLLSVVVPETVETGWDDLPPAGQHRPIPPGLLSPEALYRQAYEVVPRKLAAQYGVDPDQVRHCTIQEGWVGHWRDRWVYKLTGQAVLHRSWLLGGTQRITWTVILDARTGSLIPEARPDEVEPP